uniref:Uncharacterized protein n=1 Tax=Rhizophora mucronata TaxID=61149 RepID=A0A2P2NHB1_RHIMU
MQRSTKIGDLLIHRVFCWFDLEIYLNLYSEAVFSYVSVDEKLLNSRSIFVGKSSFCVC